MFWRGVIGYLPVNLVQGVVGFGAIVVFTRLLSPEDYGGYALAFSVVAMTHLIGLTWIEAAMARFYAAEPQGQPRADLFATLYRSFGVVALAAPFPIAAALWLAPFAAGLKLAIAAGLASVIARSLLKLAQERRRAAGEVRASRSTTWSRPAAASRSARAWPWRVGARPPRSLARGRRRRSACCGRWPPNSNRRVGVALTRSGCAPTPPTACRSRCRSC